MKKLGILLTAFFIFLFSTLFCNAQGIEKQHKDSLESIIKEYYSLNIKIFTSDSNVEDIDNVFKLFTDDFIYIHPKYGGTYSREDLYNGYVRNQNNGGYDGSVIDIKIVNMIIGLNAVVVEKRFVNIDDSEGDLQMTLFEITKGKISKITEYW